MTDITPLVDFGKLIAELREARIPFELRQHYEENTGNVTMTLKFEASPISWRPVYASVCE